MKKIKEGKKNYYQSCKTVQLKFGFELPESATKNFAYLKTPEVQYLSCNNIFIKFS